VNHNLVHKLQKILRSIRDDWEEGGNKTSARVLISYSTGNRSGVDDDGVGMGTIYAAILSIQLSQYGIKTHTGLHTRGGEDWTSFKTLLYGPYKECEVLILILTSDFYNSKACLDEVYSAILGKVKIIPVLFQPMKELPSLKQQWKWTQASEDTSTAEERNVKSKVITYLQQVNHHNPYCPYDHYSPKASLVTQIGTLLDMNIDVKCDDNDSD